MWKPIKDFENYEVSDAGEIRNVKFNRLLTPSPGAGGYMRVQLRRDKQSYQRYIHRLVAEAFLEGEGEVNHLDGNRANNNVSNLEWTTHAKNVQHAFDVLHRKPPRETRGIRVEYLNGTIMEFSSVKECATYYKVDNKTIHDYIKYSLSPLRMIQANFYYI